MIAAVTDQPGETLPRIAAAKEALHAAFDMARNEAAGGLGGFDQRWELLPGDAPQELDGGALVVDGRGHGHGWVHASCQDSASLQCRLSRS